MNQEIKERIEEKTGSRIISGGSLGGGCISDAFKIVLDSGVSYFLKINESSPPDMFKKEADGLIELKSAGAVRLPQVIMFDVDFILLEYIDGKSESKNFFQNFGRSLAQLHKTKGEYFGFYEDNYIGSTVQQNIPSENEKDSWVSFFLNKRILYQVRLAERNGYSTKELIEAASLLEKKIHTIISTNEKPVLMHGDLWNGNFITDEKGEAVLIDPAVYYGHREADLAMTKLFGGFSPGFYQAYSEIYPLEDDYSYRENIYKLYHVLNHLNLFGRGYYHQALSLIKFYI